MLPGGIENDFGRIESIRQMAGFAFSFLAFLAIAGGIVIVVLTLRHRRALADIERLAGRESRRGLEIEQARRQAGEREAQLRAVLDNMIDGVLTVDAQGSVCSFNAAAEKLFGYSSQELLGYDVSRLYSGDDAADLSVFLSGGGDRMGKREGFHREVTGFDKAGRKVPLDISISEMWLGDQRQFIVILRDISARKKALAKISEVENRLVNAINALPDGFVLYDRDDRLVMCNDKYLEIYATSSGIIKVGEKFEDMVRAGVRRGQYAEAIDDEESWIAERMSHHLDAAGVVEQQLDDGRWLRIFEQRTPDGGTVGFRVDITELKQREAALQRSENLFRATVSGAFDGIIVTDETGKILAFNPAAESLFGYAAEEVSGVGVYDLLLPEPMCSRYKAGLAAYLETGYGPLLGRRREEECLRKDGSTVLVEVAVNASGVAGEQLFIANVRDIAEEKAHALALEDARDKAEVASRAKASFLAMMSHEIRTPLNGVLGLLDLLAETKLNEKQIGYVRTANESAYALLAIINDILVFSKLEAGKLDLEPSAGSLYRLLEGVRALMAPRAEEQQLALEVSIAEGTPDNVWVDAGRLRQVLLNLVGNALKFTETGTVSIELASVGFEAGEEMHRLRFAVRDTGIGIPADKIPDLFAEFSTLDASYSRRYEGTGLGLAISRELVERMGGRIDVESTIGEGSVFRFDLALREVPADTSSVDTQTLDRTTLAIVEGARILLAEDNATNRMVLSEMLRGVGCEVSFAATGREAVDKARAKAFDAILMDISMPEMDGVEATRILRGSTRSCSEVPIIALTAHALPEDRERTLASGMNAFLSKPVSKHDLVTTLAGVLAGLLISDPQQGGAHRLRSVAVDAGVSGKAVEERSMADKSDRVAPNSRSNAPQHGADDAAVLDRVALAALFADLPTDLRDKVLVQFEADTRQRLKQISEGMAQGDPQSIGAATHVLTSLLGTFGAMYASNLSADIDQQIRSGAQIDELGTVPELLDHTEAVVAAVLGFCEQEFKAAPVVNATAGDH